MSGDSVGLPSDDKPGPHEPASPGQPKVIGPTGAIARSGEPTEPGNTAKKIQLKRDCIDFLNITVLVFAFFAAVAAALEAHRLADLTQTAITNADTESKRQAGDTQTALSLSKQAAEAAARAVETTISSERARIFVIPVPVNRADNTTPITSVSYQIINLGRTSGLITDVDADCDVVPNGVAHLPGYSSGNDHSANEAIIAGGTYNVPMPCTFTSPISGEETAELGKTKIIWFRGYVVFQDVYGTTWKKYFGLYSLGDKSVSFFATSQIGSYNREEKTGQ
jgi:hypothetical protein